MAKKLIVVVDDDVEFTGMAKILLERTGLFDVGVCNRGDVAIEMIREWKPDLVLLDIIMPGMDGTEIASVLRKDKELNSVPVIFSTSLVTKEEASEHPVIGNYPFISKPISGAALVKRIREFFLN